MSCSGRIRAYVYVKTDGPHENVKKSRGALTKIGKQFRPSRSPYDLQCLSAESGDHLFGSFTVFACRIYMMIHDPERKAGKTKGLGVIAARSSFLAVEPSWNVACMVQWLWDWREQLNNNWSSCLHIATPDAIACDDGDPNQSILFTPLPTGGLLVCKLY